MNVIRHSVTRLPATQPGLAEQLVRAGLAAFAALHFGLAILMALAPHTFYKAIGPFGAYNAHYTRDVATFYAAFGAGALLAISRPAWRVPVLAVTTVQYALHSLNHLLDIGKSAPGWTGYFDFASLTVSTLLLAWLLALATAAPDAAGVPVSAQLSSSPQPQPTPHRRPT